MIDRKIKNKKYIRIISTKISFFVGIFFILTGLLFNEFFIRGVLSSDGSLGARTRIIILFFNVIFLITGVFIIKYDLLKLHIKEILFFSVVFISFLFLIEGGLRLYYFGAHKLNYVDRNNSLYVGWETAPNVNHNNFQKGYGKITYSTTNNGFRVYGNINTKKKKIFVIGDSFTQATTVSDGYTYYDFLMKNGKFLEIFAYGCDGYGSLQEFMILDKYIDIISPDLILWQFCSNDFINNDYDLESASYINNNQMVRPYFIDGNIKWLYPKQKSGLLYNIVQSSYLLRFINIRLNILKAETTRYSIEEKLTPDAEIFLKSMKTTSEIMGLVKKRAGGIPIVAFTVDDPKWIGDSFNKICGEHQIYFIPDIPKKIREAHEKGIVVDGSPYNTHYNDNGHKIIGETILDYLIKNLF